MKKPDSVACLANKNYYRWQQLLLSLAIAFIATNVHAFNAQPNVVVILADDIGIGDIQGYIDYANPADSTSKIATPNLDRLAAEGIKFTRSYTSTPKCAPSRYALLTGNYHWRGLKNFGQWNYKGGSQILPGQATIATELKKSGYVSATTGKWHLGGEFYKQGSNTFATSNDSDSIVDFDRPMQDGPLAHGFDFSYSLIRGIQKEPYAYFANDDMLVKTSDLITWTAGSYGNSEIKTTGLGEPTYDSSLAGSRFIYKALQFIDAHTSNPVTAQKPFFLYYPATEVHLPYTPVDTLNGVQIKGSSFNARADMVVEFDAAIGLLLDYLDAHNLASNTLIILTSDNGASKEP